MRAFVCGWLTFVIAVSMAACASGSDASDPAGPDDVVEVSDTAAGDEAVVGTDPSPEEILAVDVAEIAPEAEAVVGTDPGPEEIVAVDVAEIAPEAETSEPSPSEPVDEVFDTPEAEPEFTPIEVVEVTDEVAETGVETAAPVYPEVCLGLYDPSAPTCPVDLPAFNCCDTQNRAIRCIDGQLFCNDCVNGPQPPANPKTCGWGGSYYGCGYTDLAPDVDHPRECTF